MNLIDYYHKFFECIHKDICENDKILLSSATNIYLYILENKIKGPEKIVVNEFNKVNEKRTCIDINIYIVFILYKDYVFILTNINKKPTINLYIYTDDLFLIVCRNNRINTILDWLSIDDLKEKIIKGLNFLIFNLCMFEQRSMCLDNDEFTVECSPGICNVINSFARGISLRALSYKHYDIYDNFNQFSYLNVYFNEYIIDKNPIGKYIGSIHYVSLDKERGLLLVPYPESIIICFYTNEKMIIAEGSSIKHFEVIFKLIHKEDLYKKLLKIYECN